jgi:hypothetical protein
MGFYTVSTLPSSVIEEQILTVSNTVQPVEKRFDKAHQQKRMDSSCSESKLSR